MSQKNLNRIVIILLIIHCFSGCATHIDLHAKHEPPLVVSREVGLEAEVVATHSKLKTSYVIPTLEPIQMPIFVAKNADATQSSNVTKIADVSASAEALTYTIKQGDTLSKVARQHSIELSALIRHNNIQQPDFIAIGTTIEIPSSNIDFIWPLQNVRVSSGFGTRGGKHKGVDLAAPKGAVIMASADGKVVFSGALRGYGKVIIIEHTEDIKTLYAHNSKNLVETNQQVLQGEVIGYVGKTGRATGNHLHFEYIQQDMPLNPQHYLVKHSDVNPHDGLLLSRRELPLSATR